ncbi:hypothetical protein VN97_g5203 [Penicillium thymicola]|uniref:Uncharacterized protein n=1 Tax=Penicillium thymicola TaxID=293382 RepID=A0AAI9X9F0_PENTH|nr:hypothetical protein VN97_g5203 [Penicillium thymicola]
MGCEAAGRKLPARQEPASTCRASNQYEGCRSQGNAPHPAMFIGNAMFTSNALTTCRATLSAELFLPPATQFTANHALHVRGRILDL